ncbi:MAG TPA: hypothetical protein VEV17_09550 [Bryobacteraceae bacterium]|nr:hypothetical protein [Bryobacteraceae bacterium]
MQPDGSRIFLDRRASLPPHFRKIVAPDEGVLERCGKRFNLGSRYNPSAPPRLDAFGRAGLVCDNHRQTTSQTFDQNKRQTIFQSGNDKQFRFLIYGDRIAGFHHDFESRTLARQKLAAVRIARSPGHSETNALCTERPYRSEKINEPLPQIQAPDVANTQRAAASRLKTSGRILEPRMKTLQVYDLSKNVNLGRGHATVLHRSLAPRGIDTNTIGQLVFFLDPFQHGGRGMSVKLLSEPSL